MPVNQYLKLKRENPDFTSRVIVYGDVRYIGLAFAWGCLDYIKDPFSPEEFAVRLFKHLQISFVFNTKTKLHLTSLGFFINEKFMDLNFHEHCLLKRLILSGENPVSRKDLELSVWKAVRSNSRRLDMQISKLRKLLEAQSDESDSQTRYIKTYTGFGYGLVKNIDS